MPRGELTCRCPGSKSVLHVYVGNRRLGYLCEECSRHSPTLRSFLQAVSWLYDWRHLTFSFAHAGVTNKGFHDYMDIVIRQEGERVACRREDKLARRVAWAAGSLSRDWPGVTELAAVTLDESQVAAGGVNCSMV